MHTIRSKNNFELAQQYIPGGVNSPVRAFKSVGGHPVFMKKAKGAYLYDVDDNAYIDCVNSWGPMILGHNHPEVIRAIELQLKEAISFGAPTEVETALAKLVLEMVPNMDLVRFVSSGTEACMTAIRLARGYTGKNKFIKFEGCYHGHADMFLNKAGSGLATLGIQKVPGVTNANIHDTIVAPFNDLDVLEQLMKECSDDLAAIIIEPVAGNMGCIPPQEGYLEAIRILCDKYNCLLIFDEVMTGFRLAKGGAQEMYNVVADIVTYGKVIGGGMPVGAFAARKEIMQEIAPLGQVYQAGTLSGNPLSMRAGLATLSHLNKHDEVYIELDNVAKELSNGLREIFTKKNIPNTVNQLGSMMSVHFTNEKIVNYQNASNSDINLFSKYFHFMLKYGVYLPPSAFETWFICKDIKANEIDKILEISKKFEM